MTRFLREPASVRSAAGVIVTATAIVVGVSGVLMGVLDHSEYPNVGRGLWWAMQTVTTVGYGDVTPSHPDLVALADFQVPHLRVASGVRRLRRTPDG